METGRLPEGSVCRQPPLGLGSGMAHPREVRPIPGCQLPDGKQGMLLPSASLIMLIWLSLESQGMHGVMPPPVLFIQVLCFF